MTGDFDRSEDHDDDDVDYEGEDPLSLDIAEVRDFVDAYLLPWAASKIEAKTGLWCVAWAEHPHVLIRVMELAVSRQHAVADPTLPARWWVDVLDRHVDRLTAVDGPFRFCQAGHGLGVAAPEFASVEAWFDKWFAVVLTRRTPTDVFWCPGWQDHPEVHHQLTALWAGWEQARSAPAAMVGWWEHAHKTLAAIEAANGPFAACKTARGHVPSWNTLTGRAVLSAE